MIRCDQPGCNFRHSAPQVVGKHKRVVHGIPGKTRIPSNGKKRLGRPPVKWVETVPVPPTWIHVEATDKKAISDARRVLMCPCCGANIAAVEAALAMGLTPR